MTGMPERILWINAGGTIVSAAYEGGDPRNAPTDVSPLPAARSGELIYRLLAKIDRSHDRVDGFSYLPHDWHPERLDDLQKDSKRFSDEDIHKLALIIRDDKEHNKIMITHGTDRMAENAYKLEHELSDLGVKGKTVVFAGSMVPLSMENNDYTVGDAEANIRHVVEHIDELSPGVYVTGRNLRTQRIEFMDPASVTKDIDASKRDLQFTLMNFGR